MKQRTKALATIVTVLATGGMLTQAALVGEWTFDSQSLVNSGTSGSVHDGVYYTNSGVATASYSTDTMSGTGYSLNMSGDDDFFRINNSASGDGSYASTFDGSAFTLSMWMKTDSDWVKWDEIAGKGAESGTGGTGDGWTLRSRNYTQGDGVRIQSYTDGNSAIEYSPYPINIEDEAWHMITVTYDGSTLSLYGDGSFIDSTTASIADTSTHPLVFGARDDGTRAENILVDSIQYYDTALDATAVAAMIPEPATLGLVAMFGGAVLFVRRRFTM